MSLGLVCSDSSTGMIPGLKGSVLLICLHIVDTSAAFHPVFKEPGVADVGRENGGAGSV